MTERLISRGLLFSILAHLAFLGIFTFSFHVYLSSKRTSLTFLGSIVGKYEFATLGVAPSIVSISKIPATVGAANIRQPASEARNNHAAKKPVSVFENNKEIIKQPVIDLETLTKKDDVQEEKEKAPVFRPRQPLKL